MSKEQPKEEWEFVWHPGRRRFYFQDRVTGKSCWSKPKNCNIELPKEPPPPDELDNPPPPTDVPSGWMVAYDRKHKRHYYYRTSASGAVERTWFKPVQGTMEIAPPEAVGGSAPAPSIQKGHSTRNLAGKKTRRKDYLIDHLWDAEAFRCRLVQARESRDFDHDFLAQILKEVYDSNERLLVDKNESRWKSAMYGEQEQTEESAKPPSALTKKSSSFLAPLSFDVPETVKVSVADIDEALDQRVVVDFDEAQSNASTYMTFCRDKRSVADAVDYLGRIDKQRSIVVVNVVHRSDLLGKYADGGMGFYEDLCRRVPALSRSLRHAYEDLDEDGFLSMDEGDVLFTPKVMLARGSEEKGFPLLSEEQQVEISVVSVLKGHPSGPKGGSFGGAGKDHSNLRGVIRSLLVAPVFKEPALTTFIVAPGDLQGHHHHALHRQQTIKDGAPSVMSSPLGNCIQAFIGSLMETDRGACLGKLYYEHHFVFPPEDKDGVQILRDCLKQKLQGVRARDITDA